MVGRWLFQSDDPVVVAVRAALPAGKVVTDEELVINVNKMNVLGLETVTCKLLNGKFGTKQTGVTRLHQWEVKIIRNCFQKGKHCEYYQAPEGTSFEDFFDLSPAFLGANRKEDGAVSRTSSQTEATNLMRLSSRSATVAEAEGAEQKQEGATETEKEAAAQGAGPVTIEAADAGLGRARTGAQTVTATVTNNGRGTTRIIEGAAQQEDAHAALIIHGALRQGRLHDSRAVV
jgi:hypothetical protein